MKKQNITRYAKLIASIIALVIVAFLPKFFPSPYFIDLFIITIVNAVLGMCFIMMLRAGLINLGLAAFWGVGCYISAVLVMQVHMSFWLSLPLSAIITGIISLGFGYFLIGSGGAGFTFVILSSVIGMLFSVTIATIPGLGGYSGIPNIPVPNPIHIPFLPDIVFSSKVPFFYLALVLLVIIILIIKAFYSAWTGRAWIAIGLNPRLAESVGVSIYRYKMLSFVVASTIAGLIGSFYAHYEGFLTPNTFGIWQNIYIQIYAILGGIGFGSLGPLLGSTVMTFLPEAMRIANIIAPIITGSILILLILFLPTGLLGLLQWRNLVTRKITGMGKWIGSSISFRRKGDAA